VPSSTLRIGRMTRVRAVLAAVALTVALPTTAGAARAHPNQTPYVTLDPAVEAAGGEVIGLINSGQVFHGQTFEGIPDGLGIAPVGNARKFIDIFVAFEQSHVPFNNFADFEDSSVMRARLDINTKQIVGLTEVLPPEAGYIRFCSAFMAGPAEGFENYTFFVNEESNDVVEVVPGAQYGADPSITPYRQAGYSVYLDTATGEYHQIAGLGRHNHENTVVVPGGWDETAVLSSDDTFNAPSSQLYLYTAASPEALKQDEGTLWGFQVTGVNGTPLEDPDDPQNHANDYLDIVEGNNYQGRFIEVPADIARGTNPTLRPQEGLEAWSNDNNVFQFVRVEDIDFDPDNPREVYFADTGTTRLKEGANGRLFRAGATGEANFPQFDSNGRVFKMVLNAADPTVVDSFSIYAEGRLVEKSDAETSTVLDEGVGFLNPDNLDISANSMMVQEDGPSANDVWQNPVGTTTWTKVASTTQVATAETSGIVDASAWLGAGWWVLDVQSHVNLLPLGPSGQTYQTLPSGPVLTYTTRREDGQLLLMFIPGS
jgi:hypothetical protein